MRLVFLCLALVITSRAASATGSLPNGAQITFEKFRIQNEAGLFNEPGMPDDARQYLNFAHCLCSKKASGMETQIEYEVKTSVSTGTGKPAEVWVGSQCDNDTVRAMMCKKIDSEGIRDIDALVTTPAKIHISLADLINVNDMTMTCRETEGDALVWLLVDTNGDGTFEYTTSVAVPTTNPGGTATGEVKTVDTKPPPLPTGFNASSGEGSVDISWDAPTASQNDVYYYQAFCSDAADAKVPGVSKPDARYQTTDTLCGASQGFLLSPVAIGGDGTAISAPSTPFSTLDPEFLCGEATATQTSVSIGGLENGKEYKVAIVVVDRYQNVVGAYFDHTIVPKPVTDLWEDLHDRNSVVDGGCLLSQTYGDDSPITRALRAFRDNTLASTFYGRALIHAYYGSIGRIDVEGSIILRILASLALLPLVLLALLWHVLTLPGMIVLALLPWLIKKAWVRRLVAPATLAAMARLAHADDFEPYWKTEEDQDSSLLDVPDVKWHAGVRVGPYIPDIDLQTGQNAITGKGPYAAMFGDYWLRDDNTGELKRHNRHLWQVLPMLDVERVVWDGFGQLLVGGTAGYMQKSAYAYLDGTSEDEVMRERSHTSRNTFRLIPTAATVSYRFTMLDDMYGIPVVPYVKGGLSYYIWWMKAPSGNVSKVCDEVAADMSCASENKAYGGTFGFQASVGLSIRAERIDSDAALSMRSSGLDHAGFYAELQYAKVDGFGSDHKLWVGDNTWFAGVDFEF